PVTTATGPMPSPASKKKRSDPPMVAAEPGPTIRPIQRSAPDPADTPVVPLSPQSPAQLHNSPTSRSATLQIAPVEESTTSVRSDRLGIFFFVAGLGALI